MRAIPPSMRPPIWEVKISFTYKLEILGKRKSEKFENYQKSKKRKIVNLKYSKILCQRREDFRKTFSKKNNQKFFKISKCAKLFEKFFEKTLLKIVFGKYGTLYH